MNCRTSKREGPMVRTIGDENKDEEDTEERDNGNSHNNNNNREGQAFMNNGQQHK